MPELVTLHTRLTTVLQEARVMRQMCAELIADMRENPVSANVVVGLAQRLEASISSVIVPAQNHTGLPAYAAVQFGDPNFGLEFRLAGIKLLLEAVIVRCRQAIPTHDGFILKELWNADGSVSVRRLLPVETADLRTALQGVLNNIPE